MIWQGIHRKKTARSKTLLLTAREGYGPRPEWPALCITPETGLGFQGVGEILKKSGGKGFNYLSDKWLKKSDELF